MFWKGCQLTTLTTKEPFANWETHLVELQFFMVTDDDQSQWKDIIRKGDILVKEKGNQVENLLQRYR